MDRGRLSFFGAKKGASKCLYLVTMLGQLQAANQIADCSYVRSAPDVFGILADSARKQVFQRHARVIRYL